MGRGADGGSESRVRCVCRVRCSSVGVRQWSWCGTIGDLARLVLALVFALRAVGDEVIDRGRVWAVFWRYGR